MNLKSLVKIAAGTAILGFGTAASAAVYCPGNSSYTDVGDGYMSTTTTETPPVAGTNTPAGWGSYIYSDSFTNGSNCYWVDKNLDSAGGPGSSGWDEFDAASTQFNFTDYTLKDVVDDPLDGTSAFIWDYNSSTGMGTFTLTGFDLNQPLYIGFHFGNGGDAPDSFIVQLSALSGTFYFVNDTGTGMGLSNLYVFGSRGSVPEPGTLALLGVGLAGLALIRRRRRA